MSEIPPPSDKPSVAGRFFGDVFRMPHWQKLLLGLALAAGAVGVGAQVYSRLSPPATTAQVQSNTSIATPPPGKGFVSGNPQSPDATPAAPTAQPAPSWLQDHSGGLTRSGLGFIGAFIIGWAFRVFVKTMVFVTVLGAGALLLLSHFRVINVDFSAAEQQYASAAAWLGDQAMRLKDLAMAHLPASTSSAVGLFVGFRKK